MPAVVFFMTTEKILLIVNNSNEFPILLKE